MSSFLKGVLEGLNPKLKIIEFFFILVNKISILNCLIIFYIFKCL